MFGKGVSFGTLAGKPRDRGDIGDGNFGGQFILGGACFQFFELQRHLLDEQRRPLRPRAVDLPLQLGDPQLLMGNQGQIFRRLGARHGELRRPHVTFGGHLPHLGALDHERRFQRVDVVRQGCKIGIHARDRITNSARWHPKKSRSHDIIRHSLGAKCDADFASRFRRAYSPAARRK